VDSLGRYCIMLPFMVFRHTLNSYLNIWLCLESVQDSAIPAVSLHCDEFSIELKMQQVDFTRQKRCRYK